MTSESCAGVGGPAVENHPSILGKSLHQVVEGLFVRPLSLSQEVASGFGMSSRIWIRKTYCPVLLASKRGA